MSDDSALLAWGQQTHQPSVEVQSIFIVLYCKVQFGFYALWSSCHITAEKTVHFLIYRTTLLSVLERPPPKSHSPWAPGSRWLPWWAWVHSQALWLSPRHDLDPVSSSSCQGVDENTWHVFVAHSVLYISLQNEIVWDDCVILVC